MLKMKVKLVLRSTIKKIDSNRFLGTKLRRLISIYQNTTSGFIGDMHENGEIKLIEAIVSHHRNTNNKKELVFFDVGANLGLWTHAVISLVQKKNLRQGIAGHLFEISPDTHALLSEQFNNVPGLKVNNCGLSNFEGKVEFSEFGPGSGVSTLHIGQQFHKNNFSVNSARVTTGDVYMQEMQIMEVDLVKIDVEGFEYQVLEGFLQNIESQNIGVIQFEYGYMSAAAGHLLMDFYKLMEVNGYRIGKLTDRGVKFGSFDWIMNDFKSGPNFVAARTDLIQILQDFPTD